MPHQHVQRHPSEDSSRPRTPPAYVDQTRGHRWVTGAAAGQRDQPCSSTRDCPHGSVHVQAALLRAGAICAGAGGSSNDPVLSRREPPKVGQPPPQPGPPQLLGPASLPPPPEAPRQTGKSRGGAAQARASAKRTSKWTTQARRCCSPRRAGGRALHGTARALGGSAACSIMMARRGRVAAGAPGHQRANCDGSSGA